jgi:hypothetical protein
MSNFEVGATLAVALCYSKFDIHSKIKKCLQQQE